MPPELEAVKAATHLAPAAPGEHAGFLKNNLREYGMLISLVAIMVLGQLTNAPSSLALAAVGLTFLGLLGFALAGDGRLRLK